MSRTGCSGCSFHRPHPSPVLRFNQGRRLPPDFSLAGGAVTAAGRTSRPPAPNQWRQHGEQDASASAFGAYRRIGLPEPAQVRTDGPAGGRRPACLYPSLGCAQPPPPPEGGPLSVPFERPKVFPARRNAGFDPPNLELTDRLVAATHNNFYEFLPNRGGPVWQYTISRFEVEPWKVEVSGECHKPRTFDLDDLFGFEQEERVYRFRCVETWAMNIPWTGFPLSKLLEAVQPTGRPGTSASSPPTGPTRCRDLDRSTTPGPITNGPAPGRGHERPDPGGDRRLRQAAAQAARGARAHHRALEVRLQVGRPSPS